MRTILAVICSLALVLTGLGAAAAETTEAPPTIAADNTTDAAATGTNSPLSTTSLTFATGAKGAGTWLTARPGHAVFGVRSVYAPSGCLTIVNSVPKQAGRWHTKWWWTPVMTAAVFC